MASAQTIKKCLDLLSAAFNRAPTEATYTAYAAALETITDAELSVATTRLLRSGGQFMPSAPEVVKEAWTVRASHKQAAPTGREPRYKCRECFDTGLVLVVNRKWLAAHRGEFNDAWFVAGWMREVHLWFSAEREGDLLQTVICGCECARSQRALERRKEWAESRKTSDPKPRPAWVTVYDPMRDCFVPSPYHAADLPDLILTWANDGFAAAVNG